MTISAMEKIYIKRIGRGEMKCSDVPARWRTNVHDILSCKGHPTKAELTEVAALLGLYVPDGATNPEIAAMIQVFAD